MKRERDEDLFEKSKMSFGEHLEELRGTLWKCLLALAIGFSIGLWCGGWVVDYVQTPLRASLEKLRAKQVKEAHVERIEELRRQGVDEATLNELGQLPDNGKLIPKLRFFSRAELERLLGGGVAPPAVEGEAAPEGRPGALLPKDLIPLNLFEWIADDPRTNTIGTGVPDAFSVYIKASLLVGAVLAGPFIFYFIWDFVAAGLYKNERKMVYTYMPMSITLFLAGAAIAFFMALPLVVDFLFVFYDWMKIDATPRISEWLSFVLLLPLGFGISFQLPLVMLFLERIGVVRTVDYTANWRIAVIVICIISVFLTPADIYSMILMAVPLCVLYFGGIGLCKWMPRRSAPFGEPTEA